MEEKLKETPQFKKVGDPEWESFVEQRRAEARRRQQHATVNPYIWRDFEHFPTAWIARDDFDGSLWLYTHEPVKAGGMFHCGPVGDMLEIDKSLYPQLTFELSPIKVKLLFIAE